MPERDVACRTASALKVPKHIRHLSILIIFLSVFAQCRAAMGYLVCTNFDQLQAIDDPLLQRRITELVGDKNPIQIRKFSSSFYLVEPDKATCKACFYRLIRLIDGAPQTAFAFLGTGYFLDFDGGGFPIPELSDRYDVV